MTQLETALINWDLDWERPSDRDLAGLLEDVAPFSAMSRRNRRELARHADAAEYTKGEVVLVSGDPADYVYVILSGRAKVFSRSGTRVVTDGDVFGELALIDGTPRSASIVADADLHVLRIAGSAFREAAERDPGLALGIARELTAQVRRAERSQSN